MIPSEVFYQVQFIPGCLLAPTLPREINTHGCTNGITRQERTKKQANEKLARNLLLQVHILYSS